MVDRIIRELKSAQSRATDRVREAAEVTTGEVLPPHRPKESRQIVELSPQPARAESEGVGVVTQRKLDMLPAKHPRFWKQCLAKPYRPRLPCSRSHSARWPASVWDLYE